MRSTVSRIIASTLIAACTTVVATHAAFAEPVSITATGSTFADRSKETANEPHLIVIDGVFDDWASVPVAATDPAGDATGAFDVTEVRLAVVNDRLKVLFDTNTDEHNLQSGRGSDGSVRIAVVDAEGDAIEIDTRLKRVGVTRDGQIAVGGWELCGYFALPTFAAERYELSLDLEPIGVVAGDELAVTFSGSDTVGAATVTVPGESVDAAFRPARHAADADVRVVAFNTLRNGSVHPARGPHVRGLLRSTLPDIVLLQEEWDPTPAQIAGALRAAMPDGAEWNVHKTDGTVVASRDVLIPIDTGDTRYAAAVVAPDNEPSRAVLAVSVHFKCCGFAGSGEDVQRVQQAQAVAATIEAVRSAPPSSPLHAYREAPAVVAGDWNLVGSRDPLDVLTGTDAGVGLREVRLLGLLGRSAATWIDEGSSFAPGRLDLVAVDADGLEVLKTYVLNTRELPEEGLHALGLERRDSERASDHLPLIADLAFVDRTDADRTPAGDAERDADLDRGN